MTITPEQLAAANEALELYDTNEEEYAASEQESGGYVNGRAYENYEDTKLVAADRLAEALREIVEGYDMKTPDERAAEVMEQVWNLDDPDFAAIQALIAKAIEDDRAERADMERFGAYVYDLMDGEEWDADTTQSIAEAAAVILGKPFSEPNEGE